jgi:shikimate dehydrogenase
MTNVSALAGNHPDLSATACYAAIIGECPSKGARSPVLWNAVYTAEGIDCQMLPLDSPAANLATLVAALKTDARFIGGAVTMPHKALILPYLDAVNPVAARIGAVNALYRQGDQLLGTNTDGAGAIASLLAALGESTLGARRVVLLGCGGAGTAVAAFVADALTAGGSLTLYNRDSAKAEALANRLQAESAASVIGAADDTALEAALDGADVLINCTSVGFGPAPIVGAINGARTCTALAAVGKDAAGIADNLATSLRRLSLLAANALVFDAVYQPLETQLLMLAQGLGLRVLGGKPMNLEQAVLGFHNATPLVPLDQVRRLMAAVP